MSASTCSLKSSYRGKRANQDITACEGQLNAFSYDKVLLCDVLVIPAKGECFNMRFEGFQLRASRYGQMLLFGVQGTPAMV